MPLTNTGSKNVQPGPKPLKLFDGGGLYLPVTPNRGKWWRLEAPNPAISSTTPVNCAWPAVRKCYQHARDPSANG